MKKINYKSLTKEQKEALGYLGLMALNFSDETKETIIQSAEDTMNKELYDFALRIGAKREDVDVLMFNGAVFSENPSAFA